MTQIRIEIRPLQIKVDGPLAVGTGFRRGLIQRTVEEDAQGYVYVPGSSIKGRTRRACEQIAQQLNLKVCHPPHPNGMDSAHENLCLICRVFGAPGKPAGLRWQDARLLQEHRKAFQEMLEAQRYARTQVQLSRVIGSAAPGRLFTAEYTVEGLEFESNIEGWLPVTPIAGDGATGGYELLLLLSGLQIVNTLGGGNSRGAGWIEVRLPHNIRVDGNKIATSTILGLFDLLAEYPREAKND